MNTTINTKGKMFITFGSNHRHQVGDKLFCSDTVAVINCDNWQLGRSMAFQYFGDKWCFSYFENEWNHNQLHFFPKGYVELN